MKFNIDRKFVAAAIAVSAVTFAVSAQDTRSGYFLDDYTYRYQMNPAFGNSKGFVSMPGLGNLNVHVNGTLGVSDVLYNVNGKTTTFLNPSLSSSEVLKNIGDMNRVGADFKVNIFSVGFKGIGGYNTISINARAATCVKLPGDLFSLLKDGIKNRSYNIGRVSAFANAFGELSLGHSHPIGSDIRVGANLKFLFGIGNMSAKMNRADLYLGENEWTVTTDGQMNVNMKNFKYETEINEDTGHEYVSGMDLDNFGMDGFGMALDMGIVYTPSSLRDWSFSFALLDLGFISWSNNVVATTNGVKTFTTDKYTFNVNDDASNSFDNEWDRIKDDISALYELDDAGDLGSKTTGIGATMNIGAQYTLPVYRPLSFGVLNTTRIHGDFSWTDFRFSANIAPCKIFDAGINLSAGTFGAGFGWLANFHVTGFNLFIGMDHTLGKLAKQGVPLSTNGSVNFGMNFLF